MLMKKTYDFRLESLLNSILVVVHLAPLFVRSLLVVVLLCLFAFLG